MKSGNKDHPLGHKRVVFVYRRSPFPGRFNIRYKGFVINKSSLRRQMVCFKGPDVTFESIENENCTILIPKGNSYCRRKSSAREPRFKVSSKGLSAEIDIPLWSPIQVQTKVDVGNTCTVFLFIFSLSNNNVAWAGHVYKLIFTFNEI